jgi:hypothetical protein
VQNFSWSEIFGEIYQDKFKQKGKKPARNDYSQCRLFLNAIFPNFSALKDTETCEKATDSIPITVFALSP